MQNFTFYNPAKIVFGKGQIAQLAELTPKSQKIMMIYGGGSIKHNGVYKQVMDALADHEVIEFGGVEPNPQYSTLMKAVEIARQEKVGFLLAVGGGSVADGVKFIAAAVPWKGEDAWDILRTRGAELQDALPLGVVLTLPATGSEMNANSVISRKETHEKLAFIHPLVIPVFSILDPATTLTLPIRQTINGVIDSFVHVMEQYLTYPVNAPLQDRQAEAILLTLLEEGPKIIDEPNDYDTRANIMWTATNALNGLISCGVPQDWSTHMIGHELTAEYGLDHAQTLAIVYPAMMRYRKKEKSPKILQYAKRIWGIHAEAPSDRLEKAIAKTEGFFQKMGAYTRLRDVGITSGYEVIAERIKERGDVLGETQSITGDDVFKILDLCK